MRNTEYGVGAGVTCRIGTKNVRFAENVLPAELSRILEAFRGRHPKRPNSRGHLRSNRQDYNPDSQRSFVWSQRQDFVRGT
jgi:hypothetical protein